MPRIANATGEDVDATLTLSFHLPSGSSLLDVVAGVLAGEVPESRAMVVANEVLIALGLGDQFETEN